MSLGVDAVASVSGSTSGTLQSVRADARLIIPGILNDTVDADFSASNGHISDARVLRGAGFISSSSLGLGQS